MNVKKIRKVENYISQHTIAINALIEAVAGLEKQITTYRQDMRVTFEKIAGLEREVEEFREGYVMHMRKYHPIMKPESTVCEELKPTTITESVKDVLRNVKFEKMSVTDGCREILRLFGADLNHFMPLLPSDTVREQVANLIAGYMHAHQGVFNKEVYFDLADDILAIVRASPSEKGKI